jgi:small-conductance mechanosensitive channel
MKDIIKERIALADIALITFILILIFGFDYDVIEKNMPIMELVLIVFLIALFYFLIKWIFQKLLDDSADREEVDKEISLFIVIGIFFLLVNNPQFLINIAQIEIVFTEKYLKGLNNFLNLSLLISVELLIFSSISYFFEFNRKTTKEPVDKDGLINDLKISLDAEGLSTILAKYKITAEEALKALNNAKGYEELIREGERIYDENYTCDEKLISTNSEPLSKNMAELKSLVAEDLIASPKHIAPIRLLLNATKIILVFTAVVITPIIFELEGADYIRNLAASAGGSITVLAIIFREGAKSFTAGIRIHMDDLLRVGHEIKSKKLEIDGKVEKISATNIKVRNSDNTITNVPIHKLLSSPFYNISTRENFGRRVNLIINLYIPTMKELGLEHKIRSEALLKDYFDCKDKGKAKDSERTYTNIGSYKAYLKSYLNHHGFIQQNKNIIVRSLNETDRYGYIPIQIKAYVLASIKDTETFRTIESDIMDHALSKLDAFELRASQFEFETVNK